MAYRQLDKIILILLGVLILMAGCSKQEMEEILYDSRLIINKEEDFNRGEKKIQSLTMKEIILDDLATEGNTHLPFQKPRPLKT